MRGFRKEIRELLNSFRQLPQVKVKSMAGKGDGEGEGNTLKLEGQITLIKYVMLFSNILTWVSLFI